MMEPTIKTEKYELWLGDCLDVLPHLEPVDLLLTDPPYGIGESGGDKNRRRGYKPLVIHEDLGWDNERPNREAFIAMFNASRQQVICGANYFSDYLPPSMGWVYWDKRMGGDFSDGELIFTSQRKGLRRYDLSPFYGLHGGHDRSHPTQKPVGLISYLLNRFPDAKTVLDPFMGSGTTGVACIKNNCYFIGIEKEEKYFEIAAKRLEETAAQGMFDFSEASCQ